MIEYQEGRGYSFLSVTYVRSCQTFMIGFFSENNPLTTNVPSPYVNLHFFCTQLLNKQPQPEAALQRCSKENFFWKYAANLQQNTCDFNKVAEQFYWNHTSAWVFSCKFVAIRTPLKGCFWTAKKELFD